MNSTKYEEVLSRLIQESLPKAKHVSIGGPSIAYGVGCFEIEYFKREDFDLLYRKFDIQDFCVSNSAEESGWILVEFMIGKRYDSSNQNVTKEEK